MGNPGSQDRWQLEEGRRRAAAPLPSATEQRAQRLTGSHVVIICGGRDYADRDRVFAALDLAHGRRPSTLLVHGACLDRRTGQLLGADRWADEWARERGVPIEPHPADWITWGKAAGPLRNKQMAEAGAHGCIAFPGGSGTANMCRWAERCGIPVWRPYVARGGAKPLTILLLTGRKAVRSSAAGRPSPARCTRGQRGTA